MQIKEIDELGEFNIVIVDKPSIASWYASSLVVKKCQFEKWGFYYGKSKIDDEWYIFVNQVGRLVYLTAPEVLDNKYRKWNKDSIPMMLDVTYTRKEYMDDEENKDYIETMQYILNHQGVKTIFYAGDTGLEGEHAQRLITKILGKNPNAVEKRVWLDSDAEKEIIKGFRNAQSMEQYDLLAEIANLVDYENYIFDINFSRVFSVYYGGYLSEILGEKEPVPIYVEKDLICALFLVHEGAIFTNKITTGSVILLMENAENYVINPNLKPYIQDYGISSCPCRAGVLYRMQKLGYVEIIKQSQRVKLTPKGEAVFNIVNDVCKDIMVPDYTAKQKLMIKLAMDRIITVQEIKSMFQIDLENKIKSIIEKSPYEPVSFDNMETYSTWYWL